jgi:hypothetical protein
MENGAPNPSLKLIRKIGLVPFFVLPMKRSFIGVYRGKMVRPTGVEPVTHCLEVSSTTQL